MTQEEEAALIADESKFLMSMTVKDTEGNSKVYSFYSLTSRKAYITINGSGGFYVSANRVDKFIADAQRFFADEVIGQEVRYKYLRGENLLKAVLSPRPSFTNFKLVIVRYFVKTIAIGGIM